LLTELTLPTLSEGLKRRTFPFTWPDFLEKCVNVGGYCVSVFMRYQFP